MTIVCHKLAQRVLKRVKAAAHDFFFIKISYIWVTAATIIYSLVVMLIFRDFLYVPFDLHIFHELNFQGNNLATL